MIGTPGRLFRMPGMPLPGMPPSPRKQEYREQLVQPSVQGPTSLYR